MAQFVPDDISEQILVRLDVTDLLRFKSICKSWYFLISDSRFIKLHLKYSCNYDRNNNEFGDRRIYMSNPDRCETDNLYELVGSCDGLVCIWSPTRTAEVLVANPLTNEVKKLESPYFATYSLLCWGLGYDSSTDDYKVIRGFSWCRESSLDKTCFQVLCLKSNVWKVIGEIKYTFITSVGILCNGALHWIMEDQKKKRVILSFDLSKEKFKEIPQPDDLEYSLGVMRNRLCLYQKVVSPDNTWVMKDCNIKQSWERMPDVQRRDYDEVHIMKSPKYYYPHYSPICQYGKLVCKSWKYIDDLLYVRSLVSPHANGRLQARRRATNSKMIAKLII